MLILAGVSINIALNNNGIFKKAQDAGVEMEKAALKERIETLIVNWKADEIISGVTEERFWKDLEDAGIIEDANEIGEPDSTTTENGVKKDTYIIETTDDYYVDIIVTEDEKGNINITVGDIEPSSSTTPKVKIESLTSTETSITVKVSTKRMEGGTLTYSYREKGTTSWTEWTDTETSSTQTTKTEITITTGIVKDKIYEIKVYAQNNGESKEVTKEISTDKTAPQDATATFDKTEVDAGEKVTATVTLTDAGVGVDVNKSKYVFKNSNTAITNESEFTNTFSSLTGTTTATGTIEFTPTEAGDWYLHVLTIDKGGNKKITAITTSKVTVKEKFNASKYTWTQNKTTVIGTPKSGSDETVTLTVGEEYDYTVTGVTNGYTGKWGVLGAGVGEEAGKLLIMTTSDIDSLTLSGRDGYNNGISYLNTQCTQKCGTGARSINVDDINRVTGYDPTNQGDGTVACAGLWWEYGNKVTYTASGATAVKGQTYTGNLYNNKYEHPDGRTIGSNGVTSITETSTMYSYYPHSLTSDSSTSGTCKGILTTSPACKMIFGEYSKTSAGTGKKYWLASSCIEVVYNHVRYCIRYVDGAGRVNRGFVWYSSCNLSGGISLGVRAVISL